jgi:dTMP kinase
MIHIAFEGIDNAGKTTLAEALLEYLLKKGVRAELTKELTTPVGQMIKDAFAEGINLSSSMKTYLFAADRLERYESLVCSGEKNGNVDVVLWDRYVYSAIAYRAAEGIDIEWVQMVNRPFPPADRGYYLDVTPDESMRRGATAGKPCPYGQEHLAMVRDNYLAMVNKGTLYGIEGTNAAELLQNVILDVKTVFTGKRFGHVT